MRRYAVPAIVAAMLLLCAGLLFPAVQKVREAAARMNCAGHFAWRGLSLHNYANLNGGSFPAGTLAHPDLPPEQRLSWCVPTLPFCEEDNVFKQFDLTRGAGDPANAAPVSSRFRWAVCPSSGEYDWNAREWKSLAPLTHYVGVAGVGADAAELPLKHPRAGVFGYDRRTALPDGFPDGISNTLLLIETANSPGHWAYGGRATVRAFESEPAYIGPGRAFGGFHNGGLVLVGERTHACNVAMADGSQRAIRSTIDAAVLEALATVGGKEELPTEW